MNQNSYALSLKALYETYSYCAQKAWQGIIKNWLLIPSSLVLVFLYILAGFLLVPLGFAGGILLFFVQALLFTAYYTWLSEALRGNKLMLRELVHLDYGLMSSLCSVWFVFWLGEALVESFVRGFDLAWVQAVVRLGIVLIFNAVPEVVYIQRMESVYAISQASRFTRENWIEWYIPFLLVLLPLLVSSPELVPPLLATSHPLAPATILVGGPLFLFPEFQAIMFIFGLLIVQWFMLFRGYLFQELSSGGRRQRMYKAKLR